MSSLLVVQGCYWLLTGLWAVVHMPSFVFVTGPKVDVWLVRVVGLLIGVVGAVMLAAGLRENTTPEIVGLAIASAASLLLADVYYVLTGAIAPIYLVDALVELALLIAWGVVLLASS